MFQASLRSARGASFLLAVALVGSGCANHRIPVYTPHAPEGEAGTNKPSIDEFDLASSNSPEPLKLEADDAVRLLVPDHPELAHVAVVQSDGQVTLPMVGEIAASGHTLKELREAVVAKITGTYPGQGGLTRISRLDVLKMVVWQQVELTESSVVQLDGNVTFPLVGTLPALDRTIEEVRADAEHRLRAYLRDPKVTIIPEKLRSAALPTAEISVLPERLRERFVAVVGEVNMPGLQPIQGHLRVMDALARAGYRDNAALNSVVVIRNPASGAPLYRVLRLNDYIRAIDPLQNVYLRANDVVIVPPTLISRIDRFIHRFFTETKPVFDWWVSVMQARYAKDIGEATKRLNDILFQVGK